jgi:hypothetical protein
MDPPSVVLFVASSEVFSRKARVVLGRISVARVEGADELEQLRAEGVANDRRGLAREQLVEGTRVVGPRRVKNRRNERCRIRRRDQPVLPDCPHSLSSRASDGRRSTRRSGDYQTGNDPQGGKWQAFAQVELRASGDPQIAAASGTV